MLYWWVPLVNAKMQGKQTENPRYIYTYKTSLKADKEVGG